MPTNVTTAELLRYLADIWEAYERHGADGKVHEED
jgi:hypothetical protein